MDDDTARSPAISKHRIRRGFAGSLFFVGLLTIGLLAAGCGGGSNDPLAAGAGGTTRTAGPSGSSGSNSPVESRQSQQLQLAQCMRSHGVPNFPDPSAGGGFLNAIANSGVNTQSPAYHAALQACKKYNPAGNLTPAQSAADNAQGLRFSQCMRSHGVPSFPDPTTGPVGEKVIDLHGLGIDMSSPTFQAASRACGGFK